MKNNKQTPPAEPIIKPLFDRVVVRVEDAKSKKTAHGIIIPESAEDKASECGTVVAIGSGKRTEDNQLIPMTVAIGDTVLFSKYGFDEVQIGGVDYRVVSESNILAIIK